MSIKLKIPNTGDLNQQEYVLIEELLGPGNRVRKTARIITEDSLISEKKRLEAELVSIRDRIKKVDDAIALKSG